MKGDANSAPNFAGRRLQLVSAAIFVAFSLAVSACGTASAQVRDQAEPQATEAPATTIPDVLAAPDLPDRDSEPEAMASSMDSLVHEVLINLGETGYYGACPTVEALGLDPLSASTPEKLAEETQKQHCSWTIAEHAEGVTLNLDRLDVFGDEALYYLAVVADGGGWRLAETTERTSVGSDLISSSAVYIDDLLPT